MVKKSIQQQLDHSSIQLMLNEPFWGNLLSGIPKRFVEEGASFYWSIGQGEMPLLELCIKVGAWNDLTKEEALKYGQLKHELLHLVWGHPLMAHRYTDTKLFDIACDWVVNQYLPPSQRPVSIHSIEEFSSKKLLPFQPAAYYYQAMEQWMQEDNEQGKSIATFPSNPSHKNWYQQFAQLSQIERDILSAGIDQLIQQTIERVGEATLMHWPSALRLHLINRKNNQRSLQNWRRILRLFIGRHHTTRLKHTIRRPSKRYGTSPGLRLQQRQKVLVALDTSGSIQESDFQAFFREIHHLWKLGADLYILECDTQIRKQYTYQGQLPAFVMGRGGSSFDPPIRWANERYHPDAIVYFTDGQAPNLQEKSRYPILWVLNQRNSRNWEQTQGTPVWMKK